MRSAHSTPDGRHRRITGSTQPNHSSFAAVSTQSPTPLRALLTDPIWHSGSRRLSEPSAPDSRSPHRSPALATWSAGGQRGLQSGSSSALKCYLSRVGNSVPQLAIVRLAVPLARFELVHWCLLLFFHGSPLSHVSRFGGTIHSNPPDLSLCLFLGHAIRRIHSCRALPATSRGAPASVIPPVTATSGSRFDGRSALSTRSEVRAWRCRRVPGWTLPQVARPCQPGSRFGTARSRSPA